MIVIFMMIGFAVPSNLSAQMEDYAPGIAPVIPVPGYVILSSGDTVSGTIRWLLKYVENNPVEIKFTAENGNSKVFNASEIRGFGNRLKMWNENDPIPLIMQMEHYISLPSMKKGVPVFLNRLMDGRVTVYLNRSAIGMSSSTTVSTSRIDGIGFFWVPGEGLSIGPTYRTDHRVINAKSRYSSYLISKENGELFKIDKDNYEAQFQALFGDCQALTDEINKNPDLKKFKNFMILTEVYNRLCGK